MAVYKGQITLINVNDGGNGNNGKDSVSFVFGTNSIIIPCSSDGYTLTETVVNIPYTAFQGSNRLSCGITVDGSLDPGIMIEYFDGSTTQEGKVRVIIPANYNFNGYNSESINFIIRAYTKDGDTVTSTHTFTYSKSYAGKDGEDGSNISTETYNIKTNQVEILKFATNSTTDSEIIYSPEKITCAIYHDNYNSEQGEEQIATGLILDNLNLSVYNLDEGIWVDIETTVRNSILSLTDTGIFEIDLSKLNKLDNEGNTYPFVRVLNSLETVLKISYLYTYTQDESTKNFTLTTHIGVHFGMNKDMASLSLKANGIVASMQDSKMIFNANGLTVQNGSFIIQDSKGTNLLYADEEGSLSLLGNIYAENGYFKGELQGATGTFSGELIAASGSFKGKLEAATGSFSGDISAASGIIGGFNIGSTQLISQATNNSGVPNIILNGADGIIETENIILGTGARIKDYIKIGETVTLRNATSSTDSFIIVTSEAKEVLNLKANGSINIGNGENTIIIAGADGTIMSQNYVNGLGWKISNTESVFNDVVVRGSIRASVLEYGETQAIGGTLIIRPSSRIVSSIKLTSTTRLFLESVEGFEIGDFCRIDAELIHNYYEITDISINENYIEINSLVDGVESYPIIDFGRTDSVGIGINGSTDATLIVPQSISVFDFNEMTKQITPHIVIGKLPDEPAYGFAAGTYGLYAENVLLKGSLVTQTDTSGTVTYSGISTLYTGDNSPTSDRYKQWFGDNTGEILLWAGATGTSKEEVEASNFFVDKNGNLFAGSGYFKGTIITDATITASAIETATLRGSGDSPALTIEDALRGIVFKSSNGDLDDITVFEVTKEKIAANVPSLVFNTNFKVQDNGGLVLPNLYIIGEDAGTLIADEEVLVQAIMMDKHKISFTNGFKENDLNGTVKSYIDFYNGLSFSPDGNNEVLELSTSEVRAKGALYLEESIKYNELMEYRPVYNTDNVLIGYDLYIE